jgi:tartrate/fumarate subfamily iron-sulfur-dependent hydro-lyase alpha chain
MEKPDFKSVISKLAEKMMEATACELNPEISTAIKSAADRETIFAGKAQLKTILKNIAISKKECGSICQDTGVPLFEIKIGSEFPLDFDIKSLLTKAVSKASISVPLRQNIVDPLTHENSKNNIGHGIPYFYFDYLYGADYIEITSMLRGGGAAFRSSVFSLAPTAPRVAGIKKIVFDFVVMLGGIPCPPIVIGVGLGGTPDIALKIAFDALNRRPFGSHNSRKEMAEIEIALHESINKTGIGTLGLGGDTTSLAVHLDYVDSHVATFPVAVALSCWASRNATTRVYKSGCIEWLTHNRRFSK